MRRLGDTLCHGVVIAILLGCVALVVIQAGYQRIIHGPIR